MDNDLMARRLRPPSEPFQPASPSAQPQPPFEEAGYLRTEDAAQPHAMSEIEPPPEAPAQSPAPAAPAPSAPWDPLAREDVPWDRPSDYADQTDAATPDQPAWDRPSTADWFEPDPESDVAAFLAPVPDNDWANELSERPGETPVAEDHMAAWAQASEPVMAVSAAPVAEMEAEPVTVDPDDAYAPVVSDVSAPMGRAWPEMSGHDVGRNDATVAPEAAVAEAMVARDAPLTAPAPDAQPPAPMAWAEAGSQASGAPQPDNAVHQEAPGQTSLFPDAVEPTTLVAGLGPTPPPDLFDDAPANFASSDTVEWDAPDWEAPVDEREWEVPAAIQEAYEYQPKSQDPAVEASQDDDSEPQPSLASQAEPEPEPIEDTSADDAPAMPGTLPSVSPYSTAPAPPTPFVVRIELSIVDEAKRLANPAESARIVGAADFILPTTVDAEMGAAAEEHPYVDSAAQLDIEAEPDADVNADVYADADVEVDANAAADVGADAFMPRNAAFEPRAQIAPSPAAESDWIEPSVRAESDEHSEWLDPVPHAQPEPPPWAEPAATVQPFADPTAVPPWATARATEPAPVTAAAPLAPLGRGFAPPAPVEEAAPRWAQPTYDAEPVTNAPVAQAPSPFAPPPVAGSYAQPTYAEPLYTDLSPASAPPTANARAVAAPHVAAAPAQGQGDLWFLSTEPADVDSAEAKDEIVEGKEPSALLTGVLTIGMAVLVIVLVLVFIQLMTSLLR